MNKLDMMDLSRILGKYTSFQPHRTFIKIDHILHHFVCSQNSNDCFIKIILFYHKLIKLLIIKNITAANIQKI